MDINRINNKGFVNRKQSGDAIRNDKSVDANTPADKTASSASVARADRVQVSQELQDDVNIALSSLRKLDETMLGRVREIRSNIKAGTYSTDDVYENLSNTLVGELQFMESAQVQDSTLTNQDRAEVGSEYTQEQLESLKTELSSGKSSILSEVADRLADSI